MSMPQDFESARTADSYDKQLERVRVRIGEFILQDRSKRAQLSSEYTSVDWLRGIYDGLGVTAVWDDSQERRIGPPLRQERVRVFTTGYAQFIERQDESGFAMLEMTRLGEPIAAEHYAEPIDLASRRRENPVPPTTPLVESQELAPTGTG